MHDRTRTLLVLAALAGAATVAGADARAQTQATAEAQAQLRFTRGRELFNARNFEQALTEFRAALSVVPSPNIRLYIARSLRELGRNAEAFVELQRAGAEAADRAATEARFAPTRDAARAEAAELQGRIGRITVHVPNPPASIEVTVAGTSISSVGWDLPTPVDPGDIEVIARAPGRLPFRRVVHVNAGGEAEVSIDLAVDPNARVAGGSGNAQQGNGQGSGQGNGAPQPVMVRETVGGTVRTAGYAVAGVGALGAVGFAVFRLMAQGRYDELRMTCGQSGCGAAFDGQISEGQGLETIGYVSLAVGAVGLIAGGVMIAIGGPQVVERPAPAGAGAAGAGAARERREPRGIAVTAWGAPVGAAGGVAGIAGAF